MIRDLSPRRELVMQRMMAAVALHHIDHPDVAVRVGRSEQGQTVERWLYCSALKSNHSM
jgi:hypothetical protein